MTMQEYLIRRKSSDWKFNTIVDKNSFQHVNKIHPLKQKLVKDIVQVAKNDDSVKKIIVFGSSTRYDCDITSDLDLCIDWKYDCYDMEGILKSFTKNMRRNISNLSKGRADVVNFGYLEGTAVKDAVDKGVVVYEHDVQ